MDPNRHPYQFPDWTHTNAVVYSPDDGNILVSIRQQNWVVKVDYEDGKGSGAILWHMGEGGDFALKGGTDPTDWEYAQHMPNFFSTNTTGVFSLGTHGQRGRSDLSRRHACGAPESPPCCTQRSQFFKSMRTRKQQRSPSIRYCPACFIAFWGDVDPLANGNVEYDLSWKVIGTGSYVYEVTQQSTPQTVWTLQSTGANLYRGVPHAEPVSRSAVVGGK